MKKYERENKSDYYAELIYRDDFGSLSYLKSLVVALPRCARRKPRQKRNIQLFLLISEIPPCPLVMNTIPHAITTTTTVLIAVARLELTPSIPTLARMEVSAAKPQTIMRTRATFSFTPYSVFYFGYDVLRKEKLTQTLRPFTHSARALFCAEVRTFPSRSLAPLQLGASLSFVLPIPLPPEVAKGTIVFPVRS